MFQPHQSSHPSVTPQLPMNVSQSTGPSHSAGPSQAHFAAFTDALSALNMTPSCSVPNRPSQFVNHLPTALNITHMPQNMSQMPSNPSVQTSVSSPHTHPWYFDSGATNHITNNLQHLTNPQPARISDGVMVGNGTNLQVSYTGKGLLPTPSGNFLLSHVL